jgi:hypothetical protein
MNLRAFLAFNDVFEIISVRHSQSNGSIYGGARCG